jgi:hypothetical protein
MFSSSSARTDKTQLLKIKMLTSADPVTEET